MAFKSLETLIQALTNRVSRIERNTVPTGVVNQFAGSTAPSGWLVCDGTAVSRTDYASLFDQIGTTYGVGNGTTTFNLPNLKGRVPVGKDSGQTEFDTLGETGGQKTTAHAYYVAAINSGNQQDAGSNYEAAVIARVNAYLTANGSSAVTSMAAVQSVGGAIRASGTGGTEVRHHQYTATNLQPYIALNYIIKA